MTLPALFVWAHPDDDTLAGGGGLLSHLSAVPGQDIHVVWLTDGEGSDAINLINGVEPCSWCGITHDPVAEGYEPLTVATMVASRFREANRALKSLAFNQPGTLTIHPSCGLPDGGVTVAEAQTEILALCDEIDPLAMGVRLKTHTDRANISSHNDHLAAGQAVRALANQYPARFAGPRFYVNPQNWTDPDLASVTHWNDTPTGSNLSRLKNAAHCFNAWAPEVGAHAIGWRHSVSGQFATLIATPKSVYHA